MGAPKTTGAVPQTTSPAPEPRAGPAVLACRTRSRCRWATRTSFDDPAQSGQVSCPKGELRVLDVFVACRNQEFTDRVKDEMEALHSNMLVSYVSWSDPALSLGFAAMGRRSSCFGSLAQQAWRLQGR